MGQGFLGAAGREGDSRGEHISICIYSNIVIYLLTFFTTFFSSLCLQRLPSSSLRDYAETRRRGKQDGHATRGLGGIAT